MLRRRALLIAVTLAVPGALAAAPGALAAFGPVEPVSAGGSDSARVDTTPSGTSLVVWQRVVGSTARIEARFRALDGTYGPVLPLSDPSLIAAEPQVALDDAGNGVVAWSLNAGAHLRIQARVVNANGTLGPVKNVTDGHADAFGPQVGMGATGPALIAWTAVDPVPSESGPRTQATTMTLTSSVAPRQIISPSGESATEPQVAVNPDGKGIVAWRFERPGIDEFILARGWERGAGFGQTRELTNPHIHNRSPAVAVNGDGKTFVAWKHFNSDGTLTVQGVAGTVADPAGLLAKISSPDALDNGRPTVGLNDDGDALVAWDRRSSPTTLQVRAREVAADRSLGTGTAVSGAVGAAGETSLFPRLAMTPDGFAMVVWNQLDAGVGREQVHARGRRIDGTWANGQTLATPAKARLPVVSLDAAGDALAAWDGADAGGIVEAAGQRH